MVVELSIFATQMEIKVRLYHFLLAIIAFFAMMFLLKINKNSFYVHYFKTLEEVETRNSQQLIFSNSVELFQRVSSIVQKYFAAWITLSVAPLLFYVPQRVFPFIEGFSFSLDQCWLFLYPTRAP